VPKCSCVNGFWLFTNHTRTQWDVKI